MKFGEVRWAQLAKPTLLVSTMVAWDLFRSFKVCPDAKERVGCGKEREATAPIHKSAIFVPKFAVENLPLSITAALAPEFAVKDLPLGTTL